MWIFVVVSVIVVIYGTVKNALQKPYGKNDIEDVYKFRQDVHNPYVTPKQLDKNIRSGKYRKMK